MTSPTFKLGALLRGSAIVLILACISCSSQQVDPANDEPAIIDASSTNPETVSKVLTEAVAFLSEGAQINVAGDALTEISLLIVHRSQLLGRDLSRPQRFNLVINSGHCYLIHADTGMRHKIEGLNCILNRPG